MTGPAWRGTTRRSIVYMGLRFVGEIAAAAMAQGVPADMPIAVIDNGTRTTQRVVVGHAGRHRGEGGGGEAQGPGADHDRHGGDACAANSASTARAREETHEMELVAREGL